MKQTGIEYIQSPAKRRLDLIGGLALAGALVPVISVVAATSVVDTRSVWPFFTQARIGNNGQLFDLVKIRTLSRELTQGDITTHGTFDIRATKIGQKIREYGLDETPQITNVLLGHMSLVGIRPLLQVDFDRMADADPMLFDDWQAAYKSSKPGLTGPGQLFRHHFRNSTQEVYAESMRLDLDYVSRASVRTDLEMLRQTPRGLLNANLHTVMN